MSSLGINNVTHHQNIINTKVCDDNILQSKRFAHKIFHILVTLNQIFTRNVVDRKYLVKKIFLYRILIIACFRKKVQQCNTKNDKYYINTEKATIPIPIK